MGMTVTVEDASGVKDMFLDSPDTGALICPNTWILLHNFAEGSCLSVLCSGEFEEAEVIRSATVFEERFMNGAKLQTHDPTYPAKYNQVVLEAKKEFTQTLCRSFERDDE